MFVRMCMIVHRTMWLKQEEGYDGALAGAENN